MSESQPVIPELPARYRLWPSPGKAMLGQGGASTVWRAQDQVLGVLVALKVLRQVGARIQARLEREAALAAGVVHPNVVALHDMGRTPDGKPYLAFALASDGSMLDVATSPPPWPELLELLIGLLQALGALHSRGLLHLDVKLSNLLLHRIHPRHRVIWLADLGVARAVYGDDDDQAIVGTVSYMPSERLTGQHHLWCPSTDLFSVGVVLYRLLSGTLPFVPNEPVLALAARRRVPSHIPVRPGYAVPPGIDDIVLPMLEPDFRSRFDLAADVIRALRSLPELRDDRFTPVPDTPLPPPLHAPDDPSGRPPEPRAQGVPSWCRPPPLDPPIHLRRPAPPRRVPQAPSLLVHREIQLVGRKSEFNRLWQAARAAMRDRHPVLVEIAGDPGLGRTRLVQEFTRTLEEAGFGEGVRMDYGVRDGPGVGLLGAWRRVLPPGTSASFYERLVTGSLARDRFSSLASAQLDAKALCGWIQQQEGESVADRSLGRTLLVEHLQHRSWRGVSWLWLSEAHLAGENDDCWAIVDMLMGTDAPVLVLATTRSDRPTPSLMELGARHHQWVQRIELAPLRDDAAGELVRTYLPLDRELTAKLARHTSGNPGHMRDLLLHWIRADQLVEVTPEGAPEPVWALRPDAPAMPTDRLAFARERVAWALGQDPDRLRDLLTLALAGPGTPETVLHRVAGDGLDRLVVEGLVQVEGGRLSLVPAEAYEALAAWERPAALDTELHALLAHAWSEEGQEAQVLAQVGRHRALAGQPEAALVPLLTALVHLHRNMPPREAVALARQARQVARATRGAGSLEVVRATLILAEALWHAGQDDEPLVLLDELGRLELEPDPAAATACLHARILSSTHRLDEATERLAAVEPLLARLSPPRRADFHATRAHLRCRALDHDGALADVLEGISNRPDPDTEARARLLRVRLMSLVNPMVAWHEAMQTVEFARDHGLLRYEVLAWGLVADKMLTVGRGPEVLERLRSGVARLEAHGGQRAAEEARLLLAWAWRAAGDENQVVSVLRPMLAEVSPRLGIFPWGPRLCLAVHATMRRQGREILDLYRPRRRDPVSSRAWALLLPITRLLLGLDARLPADADLEAAPRMGLDGLFLAQALVALLGEVGRTEDAQNLGGVLAQACNALGFDPASAEPLVSRFLSARN